MTPPPTDLDLFAQVPDPFAGEGDALPAPPALPPGPSPTRAELRGRIAAAVAITLVVQIVWVAASRHRVAMADLTPLRLGVGLGVPLALAVVAWATAMRAGRAGLGARAAVLGMAIAAAPLLFALTTLAVAPADDDPSAAVLLDKAMRCAASAALLCGVGLALAAFVLRRAFPAASSWRTAAIGTACGALAAATMSLACFHTEAMHLLVGHGTMMLVGGAAGAWLGRRITRL